VLREMRASDAAPLFALLTTEEVSRFISPPPSTVEGFERLRADGGGHRQGSLERLFSNE
jgi:RimJ/RimL family protein N-acetyltransferase